MKGPWRRTSIKGEAVPGMVRGTWRPSGDDCRGDPPNKMDDWLAIACQTVRRGAVAGCGFVVGGDGGEDEAGAEDGVEVGRVLVDWRDLFHGKCMVNGLCGVCERECSQSNARRL